ncbi:MAG TPA: branched-chain amino acid ABC transporter permease [Stellaceae bacterium]|nr:branched-chain amino acid ABC transporter permease [Stellaceae bacterium]
MNLDFWVIEILNSLSLGALLFLVAAGLSMIFGLMRIVNVAHGSFYMLGAYLTIQLIAFFHDETIAALAACGVIALFGGLLQRTLIERLRGDSLRQILLTFGVLLVVSDFTVIVWHGTSAILPMPSLLSGSVAIAGSPYPIYRLFVIAAGVALGVALDQIQSHTRIGSMIRAGADDLEMLSCMGINVRRLFVIVFATGAGLAAVGGALGGVFLGVYPGVDLEIGIMGFVVVIVGGLGSIRGTLVASLLVGLIDNLTKALLPEVSMFAIYLLMVAVLVLRPAGLFGRRSLA